MGAISRLHQVDHRGHARRPPGPRPRRSGGTQTPWIWAAYGDAQATSALKTSRSPLEAGERPAAADQLADPGPVELGTAAGLGRDADLLGVHRHARRVELRRGRPGWSGAPAGPARPAAARSISRCGWCQRSSRGRPQLAATASQNDLDRVVRADDRRDACGCGPAPARRTPAASSGVACDRHQVGADVARRDQVAARRTGPTSRRRASAARGWWCGRGSRRTR